MSHIYRELKPIPIPDFCLINRGNGRVFISTRTKDNRRNQLVLGRAVKDPVTGTLSLMYPNDTFRMRYPAEWAVNRVCRSNFTSGSTAQRSPSAGARASTTFSRRL